MERSNDPSEVDIAIQKIKEEIMVINVDQLLKQISRSKNAGKKITNESGIVFIGVTGAGKSTTILSLLGHQMVEKSWRG